MFRIALEKPQFIKQQKLGVWNVLLSWLLVMPKLSKLSYI